MVTYSTMITRINSVITQFTCAGSAFAGNPAVFSASLYLFSSQPRISVSPILVTTVSDAVAGSAVDVNEIPCFVRKSLALSQSLNFDHGPTNRWKLQSFA